MHGLTHDRAHRCDRVGHFPRGKLRAMGAAAPSQSPRSEEERDYYALNEKVWPKLAPFYDAVTFPLKRLRRDVMNLTGVGRDSRVLDVATGTGAQALAFAEAGAEVIGVDISESMLRIARRKPRLSNLTFRLADATDLPFEDGSFDVCSISFGLHEMPEGVRLRALREMARVVRPSGKIVIVDYALPKGRIASALIYHVVKLYERDNYAEFVRSDLNAMLARAGIAVQSEATERRATWRIPLFSSAVRIVIGSKLGARR